MSTDVITSKAVSKDVVRGKVVCFFLSERREKAVRMLSEGRH